MDQFKNRMAQIEALAAQQAQEQQLAKETQNAATEPLQSLPAYDLNTNTSYAPSASLSSQGSILPTKAQITQAFGNYAPGLEKYSGGKNLGVDFAVKKGTPMALPPGKWEVVKTYASAKEGDRGANSGSGNIVKVRNAATGEMLAFEHLSGVNVIPGQVVSGGTVVGKTGNTGNSTGSHASIPYQNSQGQYMDFLKSPYAKYLFGNNT